MHERPLAIMVAGLVLGILVIATKNCWILVPAMGMIFLLTGQIKRDKRKAAAAFRLFLFLLCFVLGGYQYQKEQEFRAAYEFRLADGAKIVVQGELSEKEYKNEKYLYYLKNCYLVLSNHLIPCNQIISETKQDIASIGEILIVEGKISAFHQARNEGNFDELSFYQSQKIDLKIVEITLKRKYGEPDLFRESLFLLRRKICAVYELCMSKETGGVLAMMVLGEKSLIDQEVKALYQKVGISHVLAISGLHISVIGMTLYKLLRKICGTFWLSGAAAGAFMLAYGCMTGFRPSSARAILMFLLMLSAQAVGRTYDSLSALSLAAFLLLWENPFLLSYAGFLFSFTAVIGVVLVGNIIVKTFDEKKEHKIWKTFYTSFSIQLMTLPLTAYFYYEIPVYGILVNFLILPLVSVLLSVGIVGGAVGLVSLEMAKWVLVPCQWILLFYQELSAFVQKLPQSGLITGQLELSRMICYYVLLFVVLFAIAKAKKQRFFGAIGTVLLIYVLTLPQKEFELDVLDVGQGDGIYLRTESGQHLFFDGGSSDVSQVGIYRILPFLKCKGVREIDYWFVSHADKDHISGLQELLEAGYPIETLVFAESIPVDEAYEELLELAAGNQTEVVRMGYQDTLHMGDATLTCVFPYEGFISDDKNAASLVLLYEEAGFSGLLTGDIGEKEEKWIATEWEKKRRNTAEEVSSENQQTAIELDFYKVAHHGSKYSNSEELLAVLQPEFAVVSCGENNRYGHPHAETLERLEKVGCEIWRTEESGQVMLKMHGDEIEIIKYIRKDE